MLGPPDELHDPNVLARFFFGSASIAEDSRATA